MPPPAESSPVRLVNWTIILWGLAIAATPLSSLDRMPSWIWIAFGAGALNIVIGIVGLRRGAWLGPMFTALYALAFCMVLAGALTGVDAYPTTGVLCLTVLSVGAAILHRMKR
ncbi:MAG: hypothetical protein NXI31_11340 [bacterium]|nr:hypothetical protein [bacterium]